MNTTTLNMTTLDGGVIIKKGGGGSVASLMTEVTWQELKDLRDSGKLVAGMKYRMIDYDTYTSQEDTKSAMHPFDLILTTLDNKTLSEECGAIHSARDVDGYFANSNLGAWKVWYCLDNDVSRFSWAAEKGIAISAEGMSFICSPVNKPNITIINADGEELSNVELYIAMTMAEEQGLSIQMCIDENATVGTSAMYVLYYNSNNTSFELEGGLIVPPHSGIAIKESEITIESVIKNDIVGKGVIYRMLDKTYNNDIHYDFKNIMFENNGYYRYTISSDVERDLSNAIGNIKITAKPVISSAAGGIVLAKHLNLGHYFLDPRNFDGGGMGNITIVNCPKIRLCSREGYMENLYFENCIIDYSYVGNNVFSGNIKNSSFKNVKGTFIFGNGAIKYNNLDVDGVMPAEGIYDGSIKTYIRAKADGTAFSYTADDIFNALNK